MKPVPGIEVHEFDERDSGMALLEYFGDRGFAPTDFGVTQPMGVDALSLEPVPELDEPRRFARVLSRIGRPL